MGSPPPFLLKNEVLKLRSISSIVKAPAKTGNLKISKKIVTKMLQINIFNLFIFWITDRILIIVTIKLILPRILLIPAT
jgi:hypothetical protein